MKAVVGALLTAVRELAEAGLLALVLFLTFHNVMEAREVEGPSMQPTLHTGERLIVSRLDYLQIGGVSLTRLLPFDAPHLGDVIVFNPPVVSPDAYIKRIVGLPGDRVSIVGGTVYVNGERLAEPYLHDIPTDCGGRWCDVRLGQSEYYVLGDNRSNSSDSRFWGPVGAERIIGSAWLVYFPFKDFGLSR
jgi:signal peptidase I